MALITRPRSKSSDVSVNLLPSDVRTGQKTKRIFNYAAIGCVAVLAILGIVTVAMRLQINSQEQKLAEAQAKEASLQTQVASLREFEVLEQTVLQGRSLLQTALAGDLSASRFLEALDSTSPGDSSLSSVSVTAAAGTTPQGEPSLGTVQFSGVVPSMPSLSNWLDTMSEIDGLRFVYLSNGTRSDQGVTFSASAHLTEALLSGRCQGEGSRCP